jgi:hypothetical protein
MSQALAEASVDFRSAGNLDDFAGEMDRWVQGRWSGPRERYAGAWRQAYRIDPGVVRVDIGAWRGGECLPPFCVRGTRHGVAWRATLDCLASDERVWVYRVEEER